MQPHEIGVKTQPKESTTQKLDNRAHITENIVDASTVTVVGSDTKITDTDKPRRGWWQKLVD